MGLTLLIMLIIGIAISYCTKHYKKLFIIILFVGTIPDTQAALIVAGSIYHPVTEQCDERPLETASGDWIDTNRITELKWIAVSRDLHKRWGGELKFGDTVIISGTGIIDGEYVVKDIMNKRYHRKIDILVSPESGIYNHWKGLTIEKKRPAWMIKEDNKKILKSIAHHVQKTLIG